MSCFKFYVCGREDYAGQAGVRLPTVNHDLKLSERGRSVVSMDPIPEAVLKSRRLIPEHHWFFSNVEKTCKSTQHGLT